MVMDLYSVLKIVATVLIFVSCLLFGFAVGKYLRDYKIFQMIFAKIMGQAAEVDRIRRLQMRESFRKATDIMAQSKKDDKGPNLIEKIYKKISMTGLSSLIPGFSESSFLIAAVAVGIIILVTVSMVRTTFLGLVVAGAYALALIYFMNILAYKRRVSVETQLLDFVNTIATASRQYSNLVDIMGATYEKFANPLSKAMEECYIEAKSTNNNDLAIQHLKDKFDSSQFSFVMDNLLLCSKETGDYFGVATDLSRTVSIYITSYEKKQAILKNAKLTLTIMAILTIAIIYALGLFLGGLAAIVSSTGGTIVIIGLVLLYLYGLNMKAD